MRFNVMSQTRDLQRPRAVALRTVCAALSVTWAACLTFAAPVAPAAEPPVDLSSPVGLWTPLDFSTGKPMGLIRIYEQGGEFYGRIEPVPGEKDDGKRCTKCTDDRKDQPYTGLVLMRHLRLHSEGDYDGGDILDPGSGYIYGCKVHMIDGGHRLLMRGFLGISLLGRSQTWQRVETH